MASYNNMILPTLGPHTGVPTSLQERGRAKGLVPQTNFDLCHRWYTTRDRQRTYQWISISSHISIFHDSGEHLAPYFTRWTSGATLLTWHSSPVATTDSLIMVSWGNLYQPRKIQCCSIFDPNILIIKESPHIKTMGESKSTWELWHALTAHTVPHYPHAHAQGVKQSVVVTNIAKSLEFQASVRAVTTTNWKISAKNWFLCTSNCWTWLTSATNRAFFVQHACGLQTALTPRPDITRLTSM